MVKQQRQTKRDVVKKEALMPPTDAGLEAQASTGGIVFQKEGAFDWQKYQQCRMIVCQHQSGSVGARLHFPDAVDEDAVTGTKLSLLQVVEQFA